MLDPFVPSQRYRMCAHCTVNYVNEPILFVFFLCQEVPRENINNVINTNN